MTEIKKKSSEEQRFKELRTLSKGQAFLYSLPNAGVTAILGIITSFIILYYVNIMGVPPIVQGAIFSIALYIYAFLCPLFGSLCNRLQSRFGRKKTLMLITGPIYALLSILLWLNPFPSADIPYSTPYLPVVLWLAVILISLRLVGSAFYSTYISLLPDLTTDEQNRIQASSIGMMTAIMGVAMSLFGPILLLSETTRNLSIEDPSLYYPTSPVGRDIAFGITIIGIFMALFFLVGYILMMIKIKEPPLECEDTPLKQAFVDLKKPFKDKNFRSFLISYFLFWMPLVSLNYTLMPIATFLLDLRGNEFILLAIFAFGAAIAAFVIWTKLSLKWGLKKTTMACIFISIIALSMVFFLTFPMSHEVKLAYGLVVVCFCLMGYVGAMIFPFPIISDIIDTAEIKSGRSLSGPYSGAYNFVLSSAAATAMLVVTSILEIFGAQEPISFAMIFALGAILLVCSLLFFKKVNIIGTDQRSK
jgi:GPH family glycoside/pentoside/hexuronide:cation symporter